MQEWSGSAVENSKTAIKFAFLYACRSASYYTCPYVYQAILEQLQNLCHPSIYLVCTCDSIITNRLISTPKGLEIRSRRTSVLSPVSWDRRPLGTFALKRDTNTPRLRYPFFVGPLFWGYLPTSTCLLILMPEGIGAVRPERSEAGRT